MTVSPKVHVVDELNWNFSTGEPKIYIGGECGGYRSIEKVDPFPCYKHDVSAVQAMLSKVADKFPLKNPAQIYVLEYETFSRTNGWAEAAYIWGDDSEYDWESRIVLTAKERPFTQL
jgi:hypothetical protein